MNVKAATHAVLAATAALFAGSNAIAAETLPPIPNLAGKVLTVRGPVDPASLGETLMHEHIFIDFQEPAPVVRKKATEVGRSLRPLSWATLDSIRAGQASLDNGMLVDFEESLAEVMEFKRRGGGTIVDVSNFGLGRDPDALLQVSQASDLNVVMGAGWYAKEFHPLNMDRLTVEEMTRTIVRDIVIGAEGTNVRSGIIGEVGIGGHPLTDNELKSVRASARAARLTGAPISFHVGGYREEKFRVLDVVESEGVNLRNVVMGHSNSLAVDIPFARRLLARGVFIEFDYLGAPGSPGGYLSDRNDFKVARGIAQLVKEGFADRIVLSHDVCQKIQLKKYGGAGYFYIHDYFLPALKRMGVSEADIDLMMVQNPRRALTFVAPQPRLPANATARVNTNL